jgi:pimeloyl-ACP methyl ester carboxylesterase
MKKMKLFSIIPLIICLFTNQTNVKAQVNPSDSPYYNDGTYSIVADSVTVSSKKVLIYRPGAAPVGDKYPVLIFQPGANGFFSSAITVHSYDLYMKHLATYGYVVMVIDETSAGMPNGTTFKAVHDWFLTNVASTSHWLNTYADSSKVVVGGHSNGGVNASGCLVGRPNKIKGIVYFASYPSNNVLVTQDVSGYSGKVLDLSGAADATSTPADCRTGYDSFTSANCAFWVSITGMDHGGFGDYVNTSQPVGAIGRVNATATVRHFLVSFMESQFKNNLLALPYFQTSTLQPNTIATFENSCTVTIIEETAKESKVSIFPNPANNIITLTTENETKSSEIIIFDITGKNISESIRIKQENTKSFILDISGLRSGNYILYTGNNIKPIRLSVMK